MFELTFFFRYTNYTIYENFKQEKYMNFFQRYKKLFILIIFLAISAFLGYLIWKTFFKPANLELPPAINPGGISGFPDRATGTPSIIDQIIDPTLPSGPEAVIPGPESSTQVASGGSTITKKINSDRAFKPTISSDGKIQYYNRSDGKFYKLDKDGNLVLLSEKVFNQVEEVTWSPTKDKAILEYPDGAKIMYDFNQEKQVTIPSHWTDFSFSPDGKELTSKSLALNPENNFLIISNDDGSKARAVEEIGTNANLVFPSWSPAKQIIALYVEGVDFDRKEIYFIGQNSENFKSTVIEGRGLEFQWSKEGDKLLYSVWNSSDDYIPRLWLVSAAVDSIGQGRKSFDLMTWASKCTFASNTEVYCAVPDSLQKGAGFFPELADSSKDSLYKIDLTTGTKKLLAVPDEAYNISNIMVPENQSVLYFTDKKNDGVYKIDLR